MKVQTQEPRLFGRSDAARQIGCSEGLLRLYEDRGIISPQRMTNGRRIFTEQDVAAAIAFRATARQRSRTRR